MVYPRTALRLIEGEARIEGARSAQDLRAKPKSRAQPKTRTRGGVWGGGSASPSTEFFFKIESEMVHSGTYFTSKLPDQANRLKGKLQDLGSPWVGILVKHGLPPPRLSGHLIALLWCVSFLMTLHLPWLAWFIAVHLLIAADVNSSATGAWNMESEWDASASS